MAVDAGKSSLLGVLVKGDLDDGRGRARVNLFRHKHEIETGRTSSVGMEILGFDTTGNVVTSDTPGRKAIVFHKLYLNLNLTMRLQASSLGRRLASEAQKSLPLLTLQGTKSTSVLQSLACYLAAPITACSWSRQTTASLV